VSDVYDLIVLGGGIHGAGVAQAAGAAGHRVLLLEKSSIAHGTSSRSSKLIHGGLRYLETGQLSLVRESLRERETLLRIAPHLVRRVRFHLPVYRETRRRPWKIRAGLSLYALLGSLRRTMRFDSVPRSRWGDLDGLRTEGLQRVFRYWDAQTDDDALTRAVARSAEELGATVLAPAAFRSAHRTNGGYRVHFEHDRAERQADCLALVNAAGPWATQVLESVEPQPTPQAADRIQGAHIVVAGPLSRGVYYAEAPRDRRAIFFMPWGRRTLLGTTERPFVGRPDDVAPHPDEIAYLVEGLEHYFPGRRAEVLSSFAGIRVLPRGKSAVFRRSRELLLLRDRRRDPRLVTLIGGKLTTYRSSAQKVLEALRESLPRRSPVADTRTLELPSEGGAASPHPP
jgi:glycerol-3-phosphate dehydrogenase